MTQVERFDPLAATRGEPGEGPEFDVFLHGMVFLDIIFTGMPALPKAGQEVWAQGMGSCPGRHREPRGRGGPPGAAHQPRGGLRR